MSLPPPVYLGSGLDFSHLQYGDKAKRFQAQSALARAILNEKLQAFREIDGVFKVTFSDGPYSCPGIYIDARTSPVQLLATAPAGVVDNDYDASTLLFDLTWPPEVFDDLKEGRPVDPAIQVLFSAKPGHAKGDLKAAIRFADLLTPEPSSPPTTAEELAAAGAELPQPTEDIEQVRRDLRKWGYGLVKNALSPSQIALLKKAAQEQAAGERRLGVATFDGGPTKPNQRVWSLLNKGDEFLDLMNHPIIDELVPWYLGCDSSGSGTDAAPLLWTYSLNITRPGCTMQAIHQDQSITGHGRTRPIALNISWLLCDFTEKNGATRMFPGSHNVNVRPRNMFSSEGTIPCCAPAGTALLFEGRLWHGAGANNDAAHGERPCILSLFVHPAVRPKDNALLGLSWEVEERLPERHKALAALRTGQSGVGGALGEARGGLVVRRPRGDEHRPVGRVRVPHDEGELTKLLANGEHGTNLASNVRAFFV